MFVVSVVLWFHFWFASFSLFIKFVFGVFAMLALALVSSSLLFGRNENKPEEVRRFLFSFRFVVVCAWLSALQQVSN